MSGLAGNYASAQRSSSAANESNRSERAALAILTSFDSCNATLGGAVEIWIGRGCVSPSLTACVRRAVA